MSETKQDRGAHLFTIVRRHKIAVIMSVMMACMGLGISAWLWFKFGKFNPGILAFFASIFLMLIGTRIRVFQNGMEIPVIEGNGRMSFLRWEQIDRSDWDGSNLTVSGKKELFQAEAPPSATIPIPASRRKQLQELLASAANPA